MGRDRTEKVERVQFRATFDNKSAEYLEALCKSLQLKRSPLLAELILSTQASKKMSSQLVHFYRNKWPLLEPRRIETGRLFNWPITVDDMLKKLAWEVIGSGNKSETLRVLIAFYADHHNLITKNNQ